MRQLYGLLPFFLLFFTACQNSPAPAISLNGVWESQGAGWLLEIADSSTYAFYDITSATCLANNKGSMEKLLPDVRLMADTLLLKKGVITYRFHRTDELPLRCAPSEVVAKTEDPVYNFEVFATTVKEHYAFFDLNNLDWETLYREQRQKVNEQSTDAELYLVLEETLERLNDNHAYLEAPEEVYEAAELILREDNKENEAELPDIGDFPTADQVAAHHLKEDMTDDSWLIKWGKMTDRIGFVQVKAMWLYGDLDVPQALREEVGMVDAYVETFQQMYVNDYVQKEVAGTHSTMQKVIRDLRDMDAIVIDVRFNGGGQDAVAFEILSYFVSGKQQVATQQLRDGDGRTPVLPLYIKGKPNPYTKPVYVLTSPQTGSAAETFAVATLSMDHVKRIGAATAGAMSTALDKKLPNGWSFSISNELFMDNTGKNYENTGVPVDYELPYSRERRQFFWSVVNDLAGDKAAILAVVEALH